MKSVTVKIKVPAEIREILAEFYTESGLKREIREECETFLWDIYHAVKKQRAELKVKKAKAA